jgi:A/G-specific adenine glycosylase
MRRKEHIAAFAEEIWLWFARHKRELPWRDLSEPNDSQRAYQILISEVMLQQTQVSRVVVSYRCFLEMFPTLNSLAKASNTDVLLAWRGMGYNSRALRLRDAAIAIQKEHSGVFPKEMNDLLAIKGIGHYTAAAVRNFAFHIPTPCIDTNIRRIIHRSFIGPEYPDGSWEKDDAYLLGLAEEVLSEALTYEKYTAADWHAALMDFGSLVCTRVNPKWDRCPLTQKGLCKAAYKVELQKGRSKKKEPGRCVGSTFIPNRIFRGKIVEELRDAVLPLRSDEIGSRVCIDWSPAKHRKWMEELLSKLEKDSLIVRKDSAYALS